MAKKETKQIVRSLVLLSGGLDSILAAKLLLEQGIEVEGISFYSNFFNTEQAKKAAAQLQIPLKEIDISEEFLEFLRVRPKHGYGVGLNPCIDCHTLMLRKASEIMKKEGFILPGKEDSDRKIHFVATGEVLNERPMSQNRQALKIVEKESGLEGHLLRPLSAKLLEPTIPEKQGLVDREKLRDISGRSRQKQFELAKKFGITDFSTPAGGCCLTQGGFVKRLKELMEQKPGFDSRDVELVKIGRHFWVDGAQIILGRNKGENELLIKLADKNDTIIEPDGFIGPTALIRNNTDEAAINKTKELIIEYSPKAKGLKNLKFKID